MPLRLRLRQTHNIPLEVDQISLKAVRPLNTAEIEKLPVQHGNREIPLADFFDVSGSAADDSTMVWEGDCAKVKLIGTHLAEGTVRVEGPAGMHLGAEMSGGAVICDGDTADWVGAEMHGGTIIVKGNAGHLVGAAYRGAPKGMTNGRILIHGNAGNEVGAGMRRGQIAIGGRCGDAPGFNMIAGTIVLCGECGIRPGASMSRGTILLCGTEAAPAMLPTFKNSGEWLPEILGPLFGSLNAEGFPLPSGAATAGYTRWVGDFLELGKGEILIRNT